MPTTFAWGVRLDNTPALPGRSAIVRLRLLFLRRLRVCFKSIWARERAKKICEHGLHATPMMSCALTSPEKISRLSSAIYLQAACRTRSRTEVTMSLLPVFLKLDGRSGLLVGAGNVGLEKINSLLITGLNLRVIAPEAKPEIRRLANEGRFEWIQRQFEPADLDGNFVVIAATDIPEVNATVYREAVQRGILVNSVDDPPHCDFYFGSVVRRGDLQIAISTAGESPAVAQKLKHEIDEQLAADLGPWLKNLGRFRRGILAKDPPGDERKALLHQLAERQFFEPSLGASYKLAGPAPRQTPQDTGGKVFLVGAGPGDPDLLTVKAQRLIQSAQGVLHTH